jgi:hypothetical protein
VPANTRVNASEPRFYPRDSAKHYGFADVGYDAKFTEGSIPCFPRVGAGPARPTLACGNPERAYRLPSLMEGWILTYVRYK